MEKQKYYITTAIAYTSGKPHIGNTYEIVLADSIARFKRQQGYDVFFQTGTDEHGQKIELKAEEAGVTPKEFVDNVSSEIKRIWDLMDTSYDKFIRTTDEDHERQVQKISLGTIIPARYNRRILSQPIVYPWYTGRCASQKPSSQSIRPSLSASGNSLWNESPKYSLRHGVFPDYSQVIIR